MWLFGYSIGDPLTAVRGFEKAAQFVSTPLSLWFVAILMVPDVLFVKFNHRFILPRCHEVELSPNWQEMCHGSPNLQIAFC